jgi:Holliday junction DNA helicase RuvA
MIALLTGKLLEKQPNQVIVDVSGVGYEVNIPLSTFYELGEVGMPIQLRIHTHVREDALSLYGFQSLKEKQLFELLTSISGIGPKLGITILSGMSVPELVPAIRQSNLVRLTSIPGVGKKTAERLVVELRDKLSKFEVSPVDMPAVGAAFSQQHEDVISALINLGYQKLAAERAVQKASADIGSDPPFEALLRKSLQLLSR